MNTQIITKPNPEWHRTLGLMIHSNVMQSNKMHVAKLIWDRKYRHKSDLEQLDYLRKYVKISKIIHITKIFSYMNENYTKIFSFSEDTINILKINKKKKIEMLSEIKVFSETMKLSKGQKKRLIIAQDILNIKHPSMCYEIGKVLNRLFVKDISLHITEYI